MNRQMLAIIKKDIRGITDNSRMFAALLVVPIVFTVVLPLILLIVLRFVPTEAADFQKALSMLPEGFLTEGTEQAILTLMLNYFMPVFFLLIPIMAASVTAASSFVGEKEKRTLETLLYCPLSLKQIFRSKVLSSFLLSMAVSLFSFVILMLVMELGSFFLLGFSPVPGLQWPLVLLLLSPGLSMIGITLIVRVSVKAKTVEDAQQGSVFLILPVILIIIGQSSGLLLISPWILLLFGVVVAAAAALLFSGSMKHFQYETLLK